MTRSEPQVTRLLRQSREGNQEAAAELMPLIYQELHRLAVHTMRSERPGHTLQATSLVNEAYVRLAGSEGGPWQDRSHFFAAAATIVRQILVQHARARSADKRGGGAARVDLDVDQLSQERSNEELLAVDDALQKLARLDPQKARLVELRFFTGLTTDETAEALGLSARTVAREWALARAWLSRELSEGSPDG